MLSGTKFSITLTFFALLACSSHATRDSISRDFFEDDVKDEPHTDNNVNTDQSDPCHNKRCYRGEVCARDDVKGTECVCNTDCSFYENGNQIQVCSNLNTTYASECSLNKEHCLCKHNLPGCTQHGVGRIYLEYYGSCREQPKCGTDDAVQFPVRLRQWLFLTLDFMAERAALGEHAGFEPRSDGSDHHAYAVIWKFCSLDQDPQDRHVTKRELQYTVRSLRAMEGCLMPFLDGCDQNNDRRITLEEWGHCLGLDDSEITDRCESIHRHRQGRN